MTQYISHQGRVEHINDGHIQVRICQTSACASCVAKNLCNSSESKEKIIDVYVNKTSEYNIGDEVILLGSLSMGFSAVLWAYVVPLFVLVISLLFLVSYTDNEALGAIGALVFLTIYYGILYLKRNALSKKFSFTIKHINK